MLTSPSMEKFKDDLIKSERERCISNVSKTDVDKWTRIVEKLTNDYNYKKSVTEIEKHEELMEEFKKRLQDEINRKNKANPPPLFRVVVRRRSGKKIFMKQVSEDGGKTWKDKHTMTEEEYLTSELEKV